MSNASHVQVQIPFIDERVWQSIHATLDREFTKREHPEDMRAHGFAKARALFDQCCVGGPLKISVPSDEEVIATWLSEFVNPFRACIEILILEVVNRDVYIYAIEQLSLTLKGLQPWQEHFDFYRPQKSPTER